MFGWAGSILRVDLTTERVSKHSLPKELAVSFIGGRGLNSRIIYEEVAPKIDPLSPDNVVVIGAGPLCGTIAPSSGRVTVTFKSPQTGILGDANAGGHFAPELKFAGYDHIIIRGRAEKPVYIWVDDDHVEIRDAKDLWGRDVRETTQIIREDMGDEHIQVMCIGQAGENLVKFAALVCNSTRAAARCGGGAVWGSKNLKAVAVRGTKSVKVADPERFMKVVDRAREGIVNHPFIKQVVSVYGTTFLTLSNNSIGRLLTRNSQQGFFEEAFKISGDVFLKKYVVKSKGCFSCPIHCSHYFIARTRDSLIASEGVEFEALSSFGARCGNSDFETILKAVDLANRYGLDAISCGGVIAFAIECFEKGLLTEGDTDGIKLRWGDGETIIQLIHKIAFRQGFGDVLAEGTRTLAEKIGGEAKKFAMCIKGLDVNNGDYRGFVGRALCQVTSTRGACHLRGGGAYETHGKPEMAEKVFGFKIGAPPEYHMKAEAAIWMENFVAAAASAGLCVFATQWWRPEFVSPEILAEMLSSATGIKYSANKVMEAGERIFNVEKLFNVREGCTSKDDALPRRWIEEPQPTGPTKGEKFDEEKFKNLLRRYYRLRGWDEDTSIPKPETLKRLELEDLPKAARC